MKQHITTLYFLGILSFAFGCTTTGTGSKSVTPDLSAAEESYTDKDLIVLAEPTGPDALQVYDSELLYLRAVDLMSGGAHEEAIFYFEKLIRENSPKANTSCRHGTTSAIVLSHYARVTARWKQ